MARLRLLDGNLFQNIWLIDRAQAMSKAQGVEALTDTGLILFLRQFVGELQQGNTSVNVFTNLTGYLNPYTVSRFPGWNPSHWPSSLEYGLGSTIFNVFSP